MENTRSTGPADPAFDRALRAHRIFGHLNDEALAALQPKWRHKTLAAQDWVAETGALPDELIWVVRGRVRLQSTQGNLPCLDVEAGELLGHRALPSGGAHDWTAQALEPVELASLWRAEVDALCKQQPVVAMMLAPPATARPSQDADGLRAGPLAAPLRELIKRVPLMLAPDVPIAEAAKAMSEHRVSSVLMVEDGRLLGLVTDRDLRNRVVAAGLDTGRPLRDIATLNLQTLSVDGLGFDALLAMARHNIHHMPVMDGLRPVGLLSAGDLNAHANTSAVVLVGDIGKQTTVEGLAGCATRVARVQQGLVGEDATAYSTGHVLTAVTDALTVRLLQLGEAKLGPPPVPYVWVAAGSQARNEQTAKSDQDNCMVLDDAYDEGVHGVYFKSLSTFVCDGLDACGYEYCPGEMMAMTDTWRQPLLQWRKNFSKWVNQPDPTALMLTCVFFDLRAVHGEVSLLETLRREVLGLTQGNRIFLAHMANNALSREPPLGLFGGISPARSGAHRGTVDLKLLGVVPIIDLARVYALAAGVHAVNTHDRLEAVPQSREISAESARDLREALAFLAHVRLQHQARQTAAGTPPDNFLDLHELSNFERSQLKDAFAVVARMQKLLAQRYQVGRF